MAELSDVRFEHIRWFVQHIPDSKFCGELHCYLHPNDPNYSRLKEVWSEQVKASDALMRRVNALMYSVNGSEPNLEEMCATLLGGHEGNAWSEALRSLIAEDSKWLQGVTAAQREAALPSDESIAGITASANGRELNALAAEASASATKSEFTDCMQQLKASPDDMRLRTLALAFTFSCYKTSSVLGIDPELTLDRFEQMCWLIRHAGGSEFACHKIAMDPLELTGGELANELNEVLAELWCKKLTQSPEDIQLMKNAATFSKKLGMSPAANEIATQLRLTAAGKKILASASRVFDRR